MMLIGIDRIRIKTILSLWPVTKNYDDSHFYIGPTCGCTGTFGLKWLRGPADQ